MLSTRSAPLRCCRGDGSWPRHGGGEAGTDGSWTHYHLSGQCPTTSPLSALRPFEVPRPGRRPAKLLPTQGFSQAHQGRTTELHTPLLAWPWMQAEGMERLEGAYRLSLSREVSRDTPTRRRVQMLGSRWSLICVVWPFLPLQLPHQFPPAWNRRFIANWQDSKSAPPPVLGAGWGHENWQSSERRAGEAFAKERPHPSSVG